MGRKKKNEDIVQPQSEYFKLDSTKLQAYSFQQINEYIWQLELDLEEMESLYQETLKENKLLEQEVVSNNPNYFLDR